MSTNTNIRVSISLPFFICLGALLSILKVLGAIHLSWVAIVLIAAIPIILSIAFMALWIVAVALFGLVAVITHLIGLRRKKALLEELRIGMMRKSRR